MLCLLFARLKNLLRRWLILGANEQFESTGGPRHVGPHAAHRVALDHGVDLGGLQRALRHFRFRQGTEGLDYNKISVGHGFILSPERLAALLRAACSHASTFPEILLDRFLV